MFAPIWCVDLHVLLLTHTHKQSGVFASQSLLDHAVARLLHAAFTAGGNAVVGCSIQCGVVAQGGCLFMQATAQGTVIVAKDKSEGSWLNCLGFE